MHEILIRVHSILRWEILVVVMIVIYQSYQGLASKRPFTDSDNSLRKIALMSVHTQLLLGICLYFMSMDVQLAFSDFAAAMKNRILRFWAIEHNLGMVTAITLITIGSIKSKKAVTDSKKFRTLLIFFSIALLIILLSIPWPFMPVNRNWF